MWFRSIYLKTLRDFRIAILGWGIGMGFLIYAILASFPALIATPQARASLVSLGSSFTWIAEPIAIDTAGGFTTFKIGFFILLITIWPLMVGSRILRGEEERGSLDVLLSLPHGRARIAIEKLAAMWTALLAMGLLIALLTFGGSQSINGSISFLGALGFSLNIALIGGVFGALTLLLSQFTQERSSATGWGAGLLLIFIVLDMAQRLIPNAGWLGSISPIYYYNLSKPLVQGHGINLGGLGVLLALILLLNGAAIWLFARRDIGRVVAGPSFLRRSERRNVREYSLPVRAWSLRSVYARSLGMIAAPTCWWTLGIAGFAGWIIVVVKQTETRLSALYASSPVLKNLITQVGGSDANTNASLLSALFILLPLLLMAFAVTQANRWSADEEDGRLDLVLSTPQSRLRVIWGRFAALTTATIVIAGLTLAVAAIAVAASGLVLDGGNLIAATLSIIPLGLLIAAIGYLFSGWLRTALETGLLSLLLALWFFISFVGPDLNLSNAVLHLSAFYYYGTPLLHGLPLVDMLGILVVGLGTLALATVRFVHKDIGR